AQGLGVPGYAVLLQVHAGAQEARRRAGLTPHDAEKARAYGGRVSLRHAMAGHAGFGHEQVLTLGGVTLGVIAAGVSDGCGHQRGHGEQANGSDREHWTKALPKKWGIRPQPGRDSSKPNPTSS